MRWIIEEQTLCAEVDRSRTGHLGPNEDPHRHMSANILLYATASTCTMSYPLVLLMPFDNLLTLIFGEVYVYVSNCSLPWVGTGQPGGQKTNVRACEGFLLQASSYSAVQPHATHRHVWPVSRELTWVLLCFKVSETKNVGNHFFFDCMFLHMITYSILHLKCSLQFNHGKRYSACNSCKYHMWFWREFSKVWENAHNDVIRVVSAYAWRPPVYNKKRLLQTEAWTFSTQGESNETFHCSMLHCG